MTDSIMREEHDHSINNKEEILISDKCGCFYCTTIFKPALIQKWIDNNTTAICPYCGVDSIIGNASDFPITKAFLNKMHNIWFKNNSNR